jgi:hypothetical protein
VQHNRVYYKIAVSRCGQDLAVTLTCRPISCLHNRVDMLGTADLFAVGSTRHSWGHVRATFLPLGKREYDQLSRFYKRSDDEMVTAHVLRD